MARALKLVEPGRAEPAPEEVLADLVPQLVELEHGITVIRQQIDVHRVRLAKKRGVAFIRPEHIRREFTHG
jgi:hypothetical protein